MRYLVISSGSASRCVLVPLQHYSYPKKVPKNILSIFFPCIFYGITEWNSLQILQLKSIFKAHKYSSGSASNVEFFVCFQMPKWGRGGGVGGGGGEGRGGGVGYHWTIGTSKNCLDLLLLNAL